MIDPTTRDDYAKRVGSLCSDCSVLTASVLNDINQVFYGNGPEGNLSATDLSIRYVSSQEYHDLVTGESGQFESKTLYVVSSDQINAYNTQIKNVGDPEEEKDAANKQYVDSAINNICSLVNDIDSQISDKRDLADLVIYSPDAWNCTANGQKYTLSIIQRPDINTALWASAQQPGSDVVVLMRTQNSWVITVPDGTSSPLPTAFYDEQTGFDASTTQFNVDINGTTWSFAFDSESLVPTTDSIAKKSQITSKVDKVLQATENNLAAFDSNGNIKDSNTALSDINYELVQLNEWIFNGIGKQEGTTYTIEENMIDDTEWIYVLYANGEQVENGTFTSDTGRIDVVQFDYDINITATRIDIVFHNNAVNSVSVPGTTIFTLPATMQLNKARDLYVNLDIKNATQTVIFSDHDENENQIQLLNSSNNFTLSQGRHVIRILETAQSTFIVSELSMLQ